MKGGKYVIPDDQGWLKCVAWYKSECVPSQHYAYTAICVPVVQCDKPNQRYLRPTCRCPTCCDDDCVCGHVVLTCPEGLLILYRSGIFAIDTYMVNFQTCPRHRDGLGVYWKRQKRTYWSPSHPATSYAKCSRQTRGIQASTCKDFWLKSKTFLPVAAGKNRINC